MDEENKKRINNNTACGWNIKKNVDENFFKISQILCRKKKNVTKLLTYLSHDCCQNISKFIINFYIILRCG